MSQFEGPLFSSYINYGMSSWYNYWASVLVEHFFKIHDNVIPTIGLIKHVDFIFDGMPVDLKMTYLPQEFTDIERKRRGLEKEFKVLKNSLGSIDSLDFSKQNLKTISQAIASAKNLGDNSFRELREFRSNITNRLIEDEGYQLKLMTWLYANQGDRRYDNSFRIFLICVDDIDLVDGWKMKIHRGLQDKIKKFLDRGQNLKDIKYNWNGREMNTKADLIIVRKSDFNQ